MEARADGIAYDLHLLSVTAINVIVLYTTTDKVSYSGLTSRTKFSAKKFAKFANSSKIIQF